jgi:hypothetical protein
VEPKTLKILQQQQTFSTVVTVLKIDSFAKWSSCLA